jgi:hypothetical protein
VLTTRHHLQVAGRSLIAHTGIVWAMRSIYRQNLGHMRVRSLGIHDLLRPDEASWTSNRRLGLAFATFFTILAALGLWNGTPRWPIWALQTLPFA